MESMFVFKLLYLDSVCEITQRAGDDFFCSSPQAGLAHFIKLNF